ncbi:HAD family hydrolase [Methanolacinia petrolearia]|uniref:HAD family hydrolase n=1 Tax=Methanolacinia petrolearia TaxID=54120 RepID=UPI003BAA84A6
MIDLIVNDHEIKDIELIIFDKDGTLFELYPYWATVARRRAENICKIIHEDDPSAIEWIASLMGVDYSGATMNPKGPIGVFNRDYIQDLLCRELNEKGYFIEINDIVDAFKEADIYISDDGVLKQSLVPVAGLVEFLKSIKGNCRCAIFSYDQTINLKHIVELMELEGFFSMLLGGDLLEYPKPSPWGAEKIMSEQDISRENTILIGDSVNDIKSGRDAGCQKVITRRSEISDLDEISKITDLTISNYQNISVRQN